MTQTDSPFRPQLHKESKSLYGLGFFGNQDTRKLTRTLEALGISKNRPLILFDSSAVLQLNDRVVLLACRPALVGAPDNVICGWKEKDTNGDEEFCLGIMDERITVAGPYYRCRKHPDKHRTLK